MFRAPKTGDDDVGLLIIGALIFILLALTLAMFIIESYPFLGEGSARIVIACIIVFGGGFMIFRSTTSAKEKNKQAKQYDEKAYQIWLRLRYVERDHVIFDPAEKLECMASRRNMLELIDAVMKRGLPLATQHAEDSEPV